MTDAAILSIENVTKAYGGLKLFDGISLKLTSGTISSLFGGNGCGKTTLFNLIGGYDSPDSGKIRFRELIVVPSNQRSIVLAGLGRMWQTPAIFPNHSVIENLLASAKAHPGESVSSYIFRRRAVMKEEGRLREEAMGLLTRLNLERHEKNAAGILSLGERKLLSLGMLMINRSSLFLLDEPFSGVPPKTIDLISALLVNLRTEGKAIFMIEHKTPFARAISNDVYIIEEKQIRVAD